MIGVILKTVDAYVSFLAFRKQWYVPTKFILDSRDIDSTVDYVISDIPLSIESSNILIYGKDIFSFEELSNYVDVTRAIPVGKQYVVDTQRLKEVLPNTIDLNSVYDSLCKEFADLMFDSRDIPGLDFSQDGLTLNEIERKKAETIAKVLAQRAQEKLDKEEALRLEQERLKREEEERRLEEERKEAERKAEQERIENEKREAELKAAKEEAERIALELAHKNNLEEIKRKSEEQRLKLEVEAKRKALEEQEKLAKLKEEEKLLERKQQAIEQGFVGDIIENIVDDTKSKIKLSTPRINPNYFNTKQKSGGLKIGRKSTNRKSAIYVFAGALKNCGSSTIAYNFAYSLAKINSNVLLIDLDFVDNDLTEWFKTSDIEDCGIDVPFKGINFEVYLSEFENYVNKINIGSRRLSFLNCRKLVSYTPENRVVLSNFNYMRLLKALSTKYTTIVVDIGCLAPIANYQSIIMMENDCKKFVCYGSSNTSEINESSRNVYRVKSNFEVVLSKAPININRISIEKALNKPISGVVYNSPRFYPGCNLLYEDDENPLKSAWSKFINRGGTL